MATPAGATSVRRYLGEECAMSVLQNVGDELLEIGQYIYCMGPSIGGSTSFNLSAILGAKTRIPEFCNLYPRDSEDNESIPDKYGDRNTAHLDSNCPL